MDGQRISHGNGVMYVNVVENPLPLPLGVLGADCPDSVTYRTGSYTHDRQIENAKWAWKLL
jgi:hypothetical protein